MKFFLSITAFIILTTVNVEYGISRQSSTLITGISIVVEIILIRLLVLPHIKKLFK